MKRVCQWLCLISVFWSVAVFANINSDLTNYFNQLGFSSNVTGSTAYQGQEAGYYSGGSIYARDSVRDVQIAHVDLPSFRSGCGGIDLYTGGFSFVNSKELIGALKNIQNNAQGFAFTLAIEQATPQVANVMKYVNTVANEVNRTNINSCETAAGLVGSVWPKTHEAQQQVCEAIGTQQGIFSDYAAARQGCGAGGQMTATLQSANGAYKNLAFVKGNLAWKALNQNSFLRNDPQLAELFMSLSGTVILHNGGNDTANQQFLVLSSLANDNSLLKALLHGGQARLYRCDDSSPDGCLNPQLQTIAITEDNALEPQVTHLLQDMVDKIFADQKLSDAEIGLLNATRLPLYKMLNVQAAFAGDKSILDVEDYADVIATDILFQYLDESLSVIKMSSASLQYPDAVMTPFMQGVREARASVNQAERSAYAKVNMAAQLIAQTQTLEQMLAGNLSAQLNNTLAWANQLRQS
jgi:conjugative transfer pilus assembly protein TraH